MRSGAFLFLFVLVGAASGEEAPRAVRSRFADSIQIGGDMRARGEGQFNYDFRDDRSADQTFVALRTRVELDALVRPDLDLYVRMADSRFFGEFATNESRSSTYIHDAYVRWHDLLGGRIDLTAGRQPLSVADERLVGAPQWGNTGRSFDALRFDGRLGYKIRARAFAATTVEGDTAGGMRREDDQRFFGIVLTPDIAPFEHIEVYGLALLDHRGLGVGARDQKIYTAGAHLQAPVGSRLTLFLQGNGQFGEDGRNRIRAWAGHAQARYRVGSGFLKTIGVEYDFASGDENAGDATTRTFNQLFASAHDKYGFADVIGYRNLRSLRAGLRGDLHPRVSWGLDGLFFRRAETADDFYLENGTGRGFAGRGGADFGTEIDAILRWKPNPRLEIEGGYSRVFVGDGLEAAVRAGGGVPGDADFGYLSGMVTF